MPRSQGCAHSHTEIDADQRLVVCKDCGSIVDAFDTLLALAGAHTRWKEAKEQAERQARLAQQRLGDLRAEERKISGRIGRMRTNEAELRSRLDRLDAELRAFSPDPDTKGSA